MILSSGEKMEGNMISGQVKKERTNSSSCPQGVNQEVTG